MSKHLDENQEQGGLCDDNDHICDIQVVNMIYCRREWSESQFIAVASFQISKRQAGVGSPPCPIPIRACPGVLAAPAARPPIG